MNTNTIRTDRCRDTCKAGPGHASSRNLMTPADQAQKNLDILRYEQIVWKEYQKSARSSTIEAVGSIAIAAVFFALMYFIISIIQ